MNQSDNTELSEIESRDATEIVGECYKELSKYVTRTRAYASATDGLKAVYRRVVYAAKAYNKKVKSASIVGEALKYHPHGDCLRGCTKLYGLNGEFITIEELYNRGDKEFEILAVDPNNGKIVPAIAHSFRIGQYTDKVYHIKFSDGGEIQVTSNHPVFLNHMEWIKAEDLEVGDKLFSRVFEDSERPTIAGENLHELVSDYYDGELKSGYVRHHINHNPRDNTRLNLAKIPRAEHAEIHKNYLAGLAKGRIEMFSSEGKFRSKIKAKNSHLIKLVNKDYSARRFLAVIKRMRDEGVDITESNYESYRSKVYNLPRIDRLISKGYGSNFEELVDCSLPNISELYEKFYSTNESSGSSRTHSATKMIDAARKSRIYEVFDYMYAGEATHINLHIYEECRKGLINLNGRGYQNIHGRNYPILNQSEFDYYLDLYLKENVYITSIEIEEVESEPMYDFTVDNLQNMLIPTSDSTDSGYYNFISVHNSSVYDALIQMTCEYNWFPLFDGKGNFGGQGFCFTGDTKISLLDGRELSIEKIHKEFQNGNKDLWVYSSTPSGRILPRRILNTFDNGIRPIMKVVLDNGEEIKCTLNHNFMLRDGSYVEAQNLKSGDSLMPLYRDRNSRGYELVKNNDTEEFTLTHRLDLDMVEGYNDLYGQGRRVVHHKDGNKHNNNPTNLVGMTWADHTKYHYEHCDKFLHTKESQAKAAEGVRNYYKNLSADERKSWTEHLRSPEVLEKCKEGIRNYWDNLPEEDKKLRCKGNPEVLYEFWNSLSDEEKLLIWSKNILNPEFREKAYTNGIGREKVKKLAYDLGIGSMDYESRCARAKKGANTNLEKNPNYYSELASKGGWKLARLNNPHSTMRGRILNTYKCFLELYGESEITEITWNEASKARGNGRGASYKSLMKYFDSVDNMKVSYQEKYNHKVARIEILNTSDRVFDIETDEYHNFALSAGVIVHNSPAAMRYTEACLSDLARLMYLELIDYAEFIDGEAGMKEPKYLPALLPYCLLVGAGGIPVGMPVANIPPLNALDLVNYYIDILEKNPNPILPIPDYGDIILDCGREDCINQMVLNGQGRIWFKGVIIQEDDNKFVVGTETPNCSFWKLKNKLQWWIDQDILDYTDETDSNGSRHVFTITNPSKLSAQELKDKIDRTMKCSLSYNFIVEYKDGAKQCGINFIISKNLKYLRECTIRKYTSYFNKSSHQLKVYQAIEDFKNSEYLDRIAKMSSDELKNAIISLGYEEDVAAEAIKKPITYLTRSHSKEIESTKHDIEIYKRYIQNPDEYLLTLYYRVRDMISANYNKRGHSMILSELANLKPKKAKLDRDTKMLRISDFEDGINWNRNLYLIANDGTITSRYVSNRIDNEIDLSIEEHEYVQVAGDDGKYLIVILANNIFVKKLADLQGSRPRFKIWDGLTVDNAFVSKGDKIKLIDEKGNESDVINLPDWERSRISNPIRAMKYNIKKVYEVK